MNDNSFEEDQNQGNLTAVEKFAFQHDFKRLSPEQPLYQELIPKRTPGPGEQYAFAVNLDQCTGCKACVTACHNENGLEEDETWRSVGLLYGGSTQEPVMQHITTACHHCLEPGCLKGCPVNAYEKDQETGIVKHLEDQCIGCQYCTFTCPYDVPKYNPKKGIVHKCDMCISRLKVGQAPACVRACPNGAIQIGLVETVSVRANPREYVNIPDTADSRYTLPTTRYLTQKEFPGNMTSVDFYSVKPGQAHLPLIVMLILTQLSVGTFCVFLFLKNFIGQNLQSTFSAYHVLAGLGVGLLALAASIFHLGRPWYAFRAFIGIKHSWLSREIVAFGIFAVLAMLNALSFWLNSFSQFLPTAYIEKLSLLTVFFGLAGVFCSVKVYQVSHRPYWDHPLTMAKFFLTTAILGLTTILLITSILGNIQPSGGGATGQILMEVVCLQLLILSAVKLILESTIFLHLGDRELTSLKKTAVLLVRSLKGVTMRRFFFGIAGGIFFPFLMLLQHAQWGADKLVMIFSLIFIFSLMGEFLERYLFFKAVVTWNAR